eukprot:2040454-Amphidinium_carterae.1
MAFALRFSCSVLVTDRFLWALKALGVAETRNGARICEQQASATWGQFSFTSYSTLGVTWRELQ